jgi:hypothetical protein
MTLGTGAKLQLEVADVYARKGQILHARKDVGLGAVTGMAIITHVTFASRTVH